MKCLGSAGSKSASSSSASGPDLDLQYYKCYLDRLKSNAYGAFPLEATGTSIPPRRAKKEEGSVVLENPSTVIFETIGKEIKKFKGYDPELSYENRKEIANAIIYISEVIPSPWLIDQEFFEKTNADYLVHGSDNTNNIDKEKLIIFERTEGISSTILRKRVVNTVVNKAFGK